MNWNDFTLRLRALTRAKTAEKDLNDELAFHIEMQIRKNVAAGMSETEAAKRARIQFGGATQITEQCRDARGTGAIETVWQDIRYAIRGFRRSPAFVLTVVATIAVGLGLDTALFTVFNATYFRTVAVREPGTLYEASWTDRAGDSQGLSWTEYRQFCESNPAFSEAFGYIHTEARIDSRTALGTLVTGEYFHVLGIDAMLGRMLVPADSSAPGREPVIVLSYQAWRNRFLGDPNIVGKTVLLRGYPFEVVGVAPAGFAGLGSRPAEFWAPLTMSARFENGPDVFGPTQPRSVSIVGRLKAGYSVGQTQSALTMWMQRLTSNGPSSSKAVQAILFSRATSKPLKIANAFAFSSILAAFSLVLLIGCANVANMMLARSLARHREIGIRLSLGASRGRVIRQLLTESFLLAVPAAVAGIAVSEALIGICVRVLIATLPPGVADFASRIPKMHSDFRVIAFTLVAALTSAIVFGLAPAIHTTSVNIMQSARGGLTGPGRPSGLRNILVAGQVTVCVLLLILAGILLRGVNAIHSLDGSLSRQNTIEIAIQEKFREAVIGRLSAEPSVELLGAAQYSPVERKSMIPVRPSDGGELVKTAANHVSPEYFPLFEIPIVRGRAFTAEEAHSGASVAVISRSAAQRFWPNREALGRTLRTVPDARIVPDARVEAALPPYPVVTVIGIAQDETSRWIANGEDNSIIYFPSYPRAAGNELFVSVNGDTEAARRRIDADLAAVDPDAVKQIQKLQIREWVNEDAYYTFRLAYWASSAIGLLALVLTLSGIYGVLSYVISQRTKEIGIRMAMGASTHAVTNLVLKQSMRLAVIGAIGGAVLTTGVSKVLASVLVMTNTFDVAAYAGGVALVLAACAAASYLPSRRAARIDPLTTLRYD